MKIISLLIIVMTFTSSAFGQTQAAMSNNAKSDYEKTDKELNLVYQRILIEYKSDTVFIKYLREAQRQWIKFRDAQVKMKYPPDQNIYGSVVPMCRYYYLESLTNIRIKELRQWIEGAEEGDVCSGSIRLKN